MEVNEHQFKLVIAFKELYCSSKYSSYIAFSLEEIKARMQIGNKGGEFNVILISFRSLHQNHFLLNFHP